MHQKALKAMGHLSGLPTSPKTAKHDFRKAHFFYKNLLNNNQILSHVLVLLFCCKFIDFCLSFDSLSFVVRFYFMKSVECQKTTKLTQFCPFFYSPYPFAHQKWILTYRGLFPISVTRLWKGNLPLWIKPWVDWFISSCWYWTLLIF